MNEETIMEKYIDKNFLFVVGSTRNVLLCVKNIMTAVVPLDVQHRHKLFQLVVINLDDCSILSISSYY